MSVIQFESVVNEAGRLARPYSLAILLGDHVTDECLSRYHLAATRLYAFVAEATREKIRPFVNSPQVWHQLELEYTARNARILLARADLYFERLVRGVLHGFNRFSLEPPSAVEAGDGLNFKEFRGGMLGFILQEAPNHPSLPETIKTHEFMSLDATTWAYHYAQHRQPCTFFRLVNVHPLYS